MRAGLVRPEAAGAAVAMDADAPIGSAALSADDVHWILVGGYCLNGLDVVHDDRCPATDVEKSTGADWELGVARWHGKHGESPLKMSRNRIIGGEKRTRCGRLYEQAPSASRQETTNQSQK